ncbi:MAG: polysaccharide deacetylase family protein [Desulfurispora sp.]|uniref:polysaccharide deacetylase family protein n=1 Tax=Desulfurispora sp. TaxID=3014275 RepID=UPI00404AF513
MQQSNSQTTNYHNPVPAPYPSKPTTPTNGKEPDKTPAPPAEPAEKNQNRPAIAETNNPEDKVAYLTFDDGPNSTFTPQILDILEKCNIKATFFVIGRNLEKNPDVASRIISEGHALLNHTYSHDYRYIYSSPENLLADLDKCRTLLKNQYNVTSMVFRPPGGTNMLNGDTRRLLAERGYRAVGWNITGADASPREVPATQIYQNVAGGLEKVEKMHLAPIILLHDGTQIDRRSAQKPHSSAAIYWHNRSSVVEALPKILDLLKQKGYTCRVIDENTPPAWPEKSKLKN